MQHHGCESLSCSELGQSCQGLMCEAKVFYWKTSRKSKVEFFLSLEMKKCFCWKTFEVVGVSERQRRRCLRPPKLIHQLMKDFLIDPCLGYS